MGADPAASDYLIDTSVLVAIEQGRDLGEIPTAAHWRISTVTVGELHRGVIAARDERTRARRLATYRWCITQFEPEPIDESIAITWGEYTALLAAEGRRTYEADTWIAATAATCGYTLVTQDHGFHWYDDLEVLIV